MAKLLGHDVCTQSEFDEFIANRIAPIESNQAAAQQDYQYLEKQVKSKMSFFLIGFCMSVIVNIGLIYFITLH